MAASGSRLSSSLECGVSAVLRCSVLQSVVTQQTAWFNDRHAPKPFLHAPFSDRTMAAPLVETLTYDENFAQWEGPNSLALAQLTVSFLSLHF